MVISPNDFSLWSRLTGNKYPSTPKERAQKGPEVQRFIQNLSREGMLGGKQQQEKKKERSLPEKIATGALIAGGVAALGAAARDKRVQDVAQRAGATVRDKTQEFLKNLGPGQEVDIEIIENSGDVTPPPSVQQENTAPTQNTDIDDFKSAVEGKTFGSSGAVSRPEDIGDARLRSRRAYEPMIDALEKKNPGINTSSARRQMLLNAQRDVDYDIAYKEGIDQGLGDRDAVLRARVIAGFTGGGEPGKATPYREFLQTVPLSTIRPGQITSENIADLGKTAPISEQITALVNKVKPGQIVRVEATNQSRPEEFGTWKNNVQASLNSSNADNQIIKGGATIGGPTLTDEHATTMDTDNVLDNARTEVSQNRITKTILPRSGPAAGESQQEFIDREFSQPPAQAGDPTPEISGTTIDPNRFPGGTVKERLDDLKNSNYQALLSGNTTPAMQQALGGRLKNGLVYKNNPRLAARDADIITSAQISGKTIQGEKVYFGPEVTKISQNIRMGAQFPEVLQDPTRETVIFQGEEMDRTKFEKPVTTPDAQQRYEDKVQKQLDFREEKIGEADRNFLNKVDAIENMVGRIKEGQQNIKNVVAGLPERRDLTSPQKQQTAKRLGETLNLLEGRLNQERDKFTQAQSSFQRRASGLMKSTQEKIDAIPQEKTTLSQKGEPYEIKEKFDPSTGKTTQTIQPLFDRAIDSKQEFDTGVGLEKQEIETGSSRGSQLQDTGSRTKLLSISDLKGRGPGAEALRQTLIAEAERKGIDLSDTTPDDKGQTNLMKFMKNKEIVSNPIAIGERMIGTPTGVAGDIAEIYRTGDPATVSKRIDRFMVEKDPTGELRQSGVEQQKLAQEKFAAQRRAKGEVDYSAGEQGPKYLAARQLEAFRRGLPKGYYD